MTMMVFGYLILISIDLSIFSFVLVSIEKIVGQDISNSKENV